MVIGSPLFSWPFGRAPTTRSLEKLYPKPHRFRGKLPTIRSFFGGHRLPCVAHPRDELRCGGNHSQVVGLVGGLVKQIYAPKRGMICDAKALSV